MNLNQLEKIWAMTYKELQEALKSLKAEGKTKIKLNSSKNDLEKEYIKIIREDENKTEKLETEQSAKESEVMAVNVTEDEVIEFTPPVEITKELISKTFEGDPVRIDLILTLFGFKDDYYLKKIRYLIPQVRFDLITYKKYLEKGKPDNLSNFYWNKHKMSIYLQEKALNLDNIKLRHEELRQLRRQEKTRQQAKVKNNFFNFDNFIFAYVH